MSSNSTPSPLKKIYKKIVPTGSRRQGIVIFSILMGRYYRKNGGRGLGGYIRRELRHRHYARPEIYGRWLTQNAPTPEVLAAQRAQAAPGGPLISILTPVYNPPPEVLRETILSVLAQTYPHWQLCLADGHSTDPAVRVVLEEFAAKDRRIQVVFLPENRGISGNSNAALAAAEGEFVALLDHDDLLAPNHLFEITKTLRAYPNADLIYFDEDKISEDGNHLQPNFKPVRLDTFFLRMNNYLMHSALRRARVEEVGGFDPRMDGAQDWDLFYRIVERTNHVYHIPKVLYHWRQIAGSTSVELTAKPYVLQAQAESLEDHLRRTGASTHRPNTLAPLAAGLLLLAGCLVFVGNRKRDELSETSEMRSIPQTIAQTIKSRLTRLAPLRSLVQHRRARAARRQAEIVARTEPSLSWRLPEGSPPLEGRPAANDLERYFAANTGRLLNKWGHYFEVYDRHLSRYRGTDVCILEFGVSHGGSLQMWRDYFGPDAKIYGVDNNPACAHLAEPGTEIFIGDQADRAFLRSLADKLPRIDILIDDGGHEMHQQIATFEELFPRIDASGVYLCEDLHTSYWKRFGGGYQHRGSFIEYSKRLIDQINAWHSEQPERLGVTAFTQSAHSLHFYDSMLVIEKKIIRRPFHQQTGSAEAGIE